MKAPFSMCRPRVILLLGLCISAFLGCASTHQLVPRADWSEASATKATIRLLRDDQIQGSAGSFIVRDGGQMIGHLGPGGELCWQRDPGDMELALHIQAMGLTACETAICGNTQAGGRYAYRIRLDFNRPVVEQTSPRSHRSPRSKTVTNGSRPGP